MQDRLNNIRPRARRLVDIFSSVERGAPRGFVHIGEVLPTVFQRIIRAIEERENQSQTKENKVEESGEELTGQ